MTLPARLRQASRELAELADDLERQLVERRAPVATTYVAGAEVSVDELELTVRAANILQANSIRTAQLCAMRPGDVLRLGRAGPKVLESVEHALARRGLKLRPRLGRPPMGVEGLR